MRIAFQSLTQRISLPLYLSSYPHLNTPPPSFSLPPTFIQGLPIFRHSGREKAGLEMIPVREALQRTGRCFCLSDQGGCEGGRGIWAKSWRVCRIVGDGWGQGHGGWQDGGRKMPRQAVVREGQWIVGKDDTWRGEWNQEMAGQEAGITMFLALYASGIWLISLINVNAKLAKKCNTNIGPHVCFFEGLPNFWWKTKKLPTRCLQSHISPKHRLNKEHLDETFPFYRAGRLFFEMIHFCYIIWACLHHWNDIVWSGLLLWYK